MSNHHDRLLDWLDRPPQPYRCSGVKPRQVVKGVAILALAFTAPFVVQSMVLAIGLVPFLLLCIVLQGAGSRR